MREQSEFYVVKGKALPEVLKKVADAKRLLEGDESMSVQEASERVGISRSSFYKYKDDIHLFHETALGRTITFFIRMEDSPGHLADVLSVIANYQANILTIHQSIPVNGVAMLTISTEVREGTGDFSKMLAEIEALEAVHSVKIVSRD